MLLLLDSATALHGPHSRHVRVNRCLVRPSVLRGPSRLNTRATVPLLPPGPVPLLHVLIWCLRMSAVCKHVPVERFRLVAFTLVGAGCRSVERGRLGAHPLSCADAVLVGVVVSWFGLGHISWVVSKRCVCEQITGNIREPFPILAEVQMLLFCCNGFDRVLSRPEACIFLFVQIEPLASH